ncbi:hypothetical protein AAVH_17181 [Aphelenchoides avenae]|nr:hypothetical protein AAVH_17181 [Aphelenchus avenae]
MTSKDAYASGPAEFLHQQKSLRATDRCSLKDEMAQFDRHPGSGSDSHPGGNRMAHGQLTDGRPEKPVTEPTTRFAYNIFNESTAYVACADTDEQPVVLHACLAVTAMNPATKKSRRAVIVFDSGSSDSHVTSKLARLLDLPRHEMRVQNISVFGSMTPMAVDGFRTFLVLCSEHGPRLHVNVTALDCIVPSVRRALVRDAGLTALRRSDCTPTPTREMPDLLIGQDLVHLFERRLEPTLPTGYYFVTTCLGTTIGGALRSVTQPPKASTSSRRPIAPPAAADAFPRPPRDGHLRRRLRTWNLFTSRLHLRP